MEAFKTKVSKLFRSVLFIIEKYGDKINKLHFAWGKMIYVPS